MEEGSKVYMVDFSYPRGILEELTKHHDIVVLDHHKTAKDPFQVVGKWAWLIS